jgi:pyruvate/2-oxoacid:ferredoxin oxidoreductase alpha subunit
MEEKRFKKLATFIANEFTSNFSGYDVINPDATNFFITYGVNFYALQGYIHEHTNTDWGIIIIKVIQPLDIRLKEFLESQNKKIVKLMFVEQNYSGQLQTFLSPQL